MSGALGTNGSRESLLFSSAGHKVSCEDKRKRETQRCSERKTGSSHGKHVSELMCKEEAHLDIVAAAAVGRVLSAGETKHVDINNIQ